MPDNTEAALSSYDGIVMEGAWLEDFDGNRYGPGTKFRHIREVREVWTNGSGMFGPADGIDRVIGHKALRDEIFVDDRPIAMPAKLCMEVPDA